MGILSSCSSSSVTAPPTSAAPGTAIVSGTVDLSASNKPSVSDRLAVGVGIVVKAYDMNGAEAGGTTTDANGHYSLALKQNGTYVIKITFGNVVLKALVALGAGPETANVNPTSTAIVLIFAKSLGVTNFGEPGVPFTGVGAINLTSSITAITGDSRFAALVANIVAAVVAGDTGAVNTTLIIIITLPTTATNTATSTTTNTGTGTGTTTCPAGQIIGFYGTCVATPVCYPPAYLSDSGYCASPPPSPITSAPTITGAVVASWGKVKVSWAAPDGVVSLYNLYYRTSPGVTKANGTKVSNATSGVTLTGLLNNQKYYFVVTAVNDGGESVTSGEASATMYKIPRFAYAANQGADTVSMYTVDSSTGALAAETPATIATGSQPVFVTVDPLGRFAYVGNVGGSSVSMYTINQTSGLLSGGTTVATPGNAFSVAVDPSGKFAYVLSKNVNFVSKYTIDQTTGLLSNVVTVASGGSSPQSITIDPSGKYAFIAYIASDNASAWTISPSTGELTNVAWIAAGTQPTSITVDPSGKFVYVTNQASSDVSMYTIDQTTTPGALIAVTPAVVSAGASPQSVSVDPSGKFAYVANGTGNTISAYTINQTSGELTEITGSPFAAGGNPFGVAVDPSGKYVYTANRTGNSVSRFTIDQTTGALTSNESIAADTNTRSIAIMGGS